MPIQKPKNLIKYGDKFALGDHFIIYGSACDEAIVNKLIGKRKITQINSDIPYGVSYVESKSGFRQKLSCNKPIANDQEQSEEEYKQFVSDWLKLTIPYLANTNSYYIFNSDRMIFSLREALVESGFKFAQLLIWIKNSAVVGRLDYLPKHELVAYGWYGKHKFRKSKDKSLLFCPKPQKSKLHPTMKPLSLIRRLILNNTKIGDWVYDPFVGSGTCIVACEQVKRRCLAIELDPEHCATAIQRFEKLTKIKAKKV